MEKLMALIIILFVGLGCKSSFPSGLGHHDGSGGYQNLDPEARAKGIFWIIVWQVSNWFRKMPSVDPKDYQFTILKNDGIGLKNNTSKFTITWVGHATTLVQIDGLNILTDPIWSERCSPVSFAGPKRYSSPGIDMENLPKIDIVIISHNHYDHMDLATLQTLQSKFKPFFFVGLGNKKLLIEEGLQNVEELDWWEERQIENVKVVFTPTQHFSARGVFDRDKTLWGSYIVKGKKNSFYFAGDTGYFSGFQEIGKKFPNIDVAILPIGAYEPRWFMKAIHMNPFDSANAFQDLGAQKFFPMHYQTFVLTDEALDEPLRLIHQEFSDRKWDKKNLLDLKIGETRFLD
jgi:L-ascorbate metabolism protein UlaG (beta-lactamase superfamily)